MTQNVGAAGSAESAAAPACPGRVHLAPATGARRIAWYGAVVDAARPQAWTCSVCHPEVEYELCVLGGVWFVRRTGRTVSETVRDTRAETERTWQEIICGTAR